MKRERRSAKEIINDFANELLNRTSDQDAPAKLTAIETIAFRMGWNELYSKLRYRKRNQIVNQNQPEQFPEDEIREPWWHK